MVVRIDTTNITRGREFKIFAYNILNSPLIIRVVDALSHEIIEISYTKTSGNSFSVYSCIAPNINGYLFCKVGSQKIVKKIGTPIQSFALAYKENYTVSYETFDTLGNALEMGTLTSLGYGFYLTNLSLEAGVIKVLGTNYMINKDQVKVPFILSDLQATIGSTFEPLSLSTISLLPTDLPSLPLGEVALNTSLTNINITEL